MSKEGVKRKARRGCARKNALKNFKVMYNNVRGVKTKEDVIKRIINEENPVLVALVETKLDEGDILEMDEYEIKRTDREGDGGGVLVAYKKSLSNIIIAVREYKGHDCEMLWLKLNNGIVKLRIGVIYMPQESRTLLRDMKELYGVIEEEIETAKENGEKILILGDFNCKIGLAIKGNKEEITKGGRVLMKLTNKHNLKVLNAEKCCEGLWTRNQDETMSIIDYILVQEEDVNLVESMVIDEEKDKTPYSLDRTKGEMIRTYTDHFMITCKMNWKIEGEQKKHIKKLDKMKYGYYKAELEKDNVSKIIEGKPIRQAYTEWNKKIIKIRDKCSTKRKIRRKWKVDRLLTKEKAVIKKQLKHTYDKEEIAKLKLKRTMIMNLIDEEQIKKKYARVNKVIADVKEAGGVNSGTFWEVRKQLMGRRSETAEAMEDEDGNVHEDKEEIKEIYANHYEQLLRTKESETVEGMVTEEIIRLVERGMEVTAATEEPQLTTEKEVESMVNKLNVKKARDAESWNNRMIREGGTEMIKSLAKIFNRIDKDMEVPEEWERMEIKSIHKKGSRKKMKNQRGLFLTNNISKIYERIIKERNNEQFNTNITEWQTGGIRKRSTIDNVMVVTAIMERNKYFKKNTYLTFTDAEKCFDKLWLEDGINELWRLGMNIRDCIMIKRMNEVANIVVKTPLGPTREIQVKRIVRQGTVSGPQICLGSMDKINLLGKDIVTHYGPDLPIRAVAFVDDVTGVGGIATANHVIDNCNTLEETKKMTFNNTNGKTEYLVIENKKEDVKTLVSKVKRGPVERVKEHKMLGTWFDETGRYMINIDKKKQKLQFMIKTAKCVGSTKNVGILAVETRLKLGEAVILPSILYNAEAFAVYTKNEVEELEKIQGNMLRQFLEVPKSTPYYGLLMETGWLTMEARLDYRKLMLFHNIMNSDDKRTIKKIMMEQMAENREGTWYNSVWKIMLKYNITLPVSSTIKSKWKDHVKKEVQKCTEITIRNKCEKQSKTRTIKDEPYKLQQYLKELPIKVSKEITRYRLHMVNIPMNYKNTWKQTNCPLCEDEEGSTEHYFTCQRTMLMRKVWNITSIKEETPRKMANIARYMKNIETLLEPKWKVYDTISNNWQPGED